MDQYFSTSYGQARSKFLAAALAAGAEIETLPHPLRGSGGEELGIDLAWLGPRAADRVLVTISGTHGVEGYYGSACQTGWLAEHPRRLPRGVAALTIHASNPYGFSWSRRVDDANIDINRNFIDFTRPFPKNPAYISDVHPFILPDSWNDNVAATILDTLRGYIRRVGPRPAMAAIAAGQHERPDGIFYGGVRPCWSNTALKEVAERFLRSAGRICIIDFHTGLGPFGHSELICRHPAESSSLALARYWFGGAVTSPALGESDSPVIDGNVRMGLARLCSEMTSGCVVVSIAIEVGTYPMEEMLRAIIADNWLHLRGGGLETAVGRSIKREMSRMFFPDSEEWRARCYPRAQEILGQALSGLAGS